MTMKYLLAGLLGGVAMFIWMSAAHMAIPSLAKAGISEIPNEQAALDTLQTAVGEKSGLYLFPAPGETKEQQQEMMKQMSEGMKTPSGLLAYRPAGIKISFGKLLLTEFLKELIVSVIALFLLMETKIASFSGRVCFVTTVGLAATITTNISYWNWYGFPTAYTTAYMFTELVGFFCAGLVAALILRRTPPHP